jgi:alpha-beta hydrolase superfamily lysophospholipase
VTSRDFDSRIQAAPFAPPGAPAPGRSPSRVTRTGVVLAELDGGARAASAPFARPDATPRALYFGPAGEESFGWLHGVPRDAEAVALGVVLCSTLGRKEVCSHRLIRRLAMDLAKAGVPVLRFDYPGTGDSSTPSDGAAADDGVLQRLSAEASTASEGDLAHPGAWVASIGHAIETLKQACGIPEVCLIGLDAGVLLACEAARGRADVAGLIGMAPVVKGRAWLREQRAFGMRAAQAEGGTSTAALLESGSHAFSVQALAELGRMDLQAITTPPAPEVLVLERDDRPGSTSAWVEHLRMLGAQVEYGSLAGYEALMAPTYESVLPEASIRHAVDWVRVRVAQRQPGASRPPALPSLLQRSPPQATGSDTLYLPTGQVGELTVTETSCVLDPDIGLQGILTLPPRQTGLPAPTRAVVMLPAGADRRIGQGRMYVRLARRLAANGIAALRLDISGIGDSPARPGCKEDVVYTPEALQDVDKAVRYVRDVLGIPNISLVGYCSGSYNALKAAIAQTPVQSLVLVNQLVFFWKPGMSLNSNTSEALVAFAARNYRRHFMQASRWRDLLLDPHKIAYAAQVLWHRSRTILQHGMRDVARRLGIPLQDDLGQELQELARRDVALQFIFASGDPGDALMRASGGSIVRRLINTGALHVQHVQGADHEFTQLVHRLQLERMLFELLAAPHAPAAAPAPAN